MSKQPKSEALGSRDKVWWKKIFSKRRIGSFKRGWKRTWLPFLAGATATFTFFFTVLLPTTRKEIIPIISPPALVKVDASIITDTGTVNWLESNNSPKKLMIGSLPIRLKITNLSEYPLIVEEILLHFSNLNPNRHGFDYVQPPLDTWIPKREYTGGAEASYNLYSITLPLSKAGTRSLFADSDMGLGEEISKFKNVYYRIPPSDSDVIGVELTLEDSEEIEAVYELSFEIKCTSRGNNFTYNYVPPYNLILMSSEDFGKLYP